MSMEEVAGQIPHHAAAHLIFIVRGCAYAVLILTIWEWLITLRFETLVIWPPATSFRMRILYCVSRYLGIVGQVANAVVITYYLFDSDDKPSDLACRWWFGFQLAITQVLLVSLLLSLIIRLKALYTGLNTKVTRWLYGALCFQTAVVIVSGTHSICHTKFYNTPGCLPLHAAPSVLVLAATEIISHSLIWGLTLYRAFGVYINVGKKLIPLLALVTRDGFWVFVSTTVLLGAILIDAAHRGTSLDHAFSPVPFLFPVYVALVSLSSCRIIMNIYTLASDSPKRQAKFVKTAWSDNIELTSLFTNSDTEDL
ncbi:hypothetical protein CPB83DRAFT_906774 [Crepidotus variabilis]|uniref:DUF6533 domain-containing protein n=1 Tax=Crepidotus variabilis TaxID=179855 RepID=A0A9P6EGK0_9AGAR|nr:hypothetical protein CPB83DRAFT_906774 [Crepidotus variabilis]